jgi:hypothetical protein
MTDKPPTEKSSDAVALLRLMALVEVNVRSAGITSTTEAGSMCFFKPVYDKPSATTYGMRSAINEFRRGAFFRKLYCIEQGDALNPLVKFAVNLTDENDVLLDTWHLDISHGLHKHPIKNGRRGDAHIPLAGSIEGVGFAIAARIISDSNLSPDQNVPPT